jgi:hypothetical protein
MHEEYAAVVTIALFVVLVTFSFSVFFFCAFFEEIETNRRLSAELATLREEQIRQKHNRYVE